MIGAGSWGTALSIHLARLGHEVRLWGRDASLVGDMTARRANGGVPARCQVSRRASARLVARCSAERFAHDRAGGPSHGLRRVLHEAARGLHADAVVVSATKGLEEHTMRRMSEVITQEWSRVGELAVLSGPSFAAELARELPTAYASSCSVARSMSDWVISQVCDCIG